MNDTEYRQTLEKAKEDLFAGQQKLGHLIVQVEEVEKRNTGLREIVVAVSRLLGEDFIEEDALGLTDAIRQAFKTASGTPLQPTEVRTRIQQMGIDITKYGNFMASIHSVINRLLKAGEIKQPVQVAGAKPAYIWNASNTATVTVVVKK